MLTCSDFHINFVAKHHYSYINILHNNVGSAIKVSLASYMLKSNSLDIHYNVHREQGRLYYVLRVWSLWNLGLLLSYLARCPKASTER